MPHGWGAKKLLQVLRTRHPHREWPARSTVNAVLERHGLLRRNRRRRKWARPGAASLHTERPNQVWPADFKGQFKTADGQYCYPLTVTDHFSRSLLVCRDPVGQDRGRETAVPGPSSARSAYPRRSAPTTARRSRRPGSTASPRSTSGGCNSASATSGFRRPARRTTGPTSACIAS
jgi:transposase InsO family protein